jgi:hypothetical protein
MIPPPYYVTMDGINGPETGIVANLANSNDPSQPPVAKCFAPAAILLAERLRDLDSGAIALTMTWRYRDGQWAQHTVDKAIIMNPKLLLAAATYDVPVHGGNAALMSNYLYALESANRGTEGLPEHLTVAHLGWIGRTGEHGFLAGPDGMHVLSTGDRATDKTQVMFRGGDDGNHQLVAGYRAHGSSEGWLQAVRLIADKPVPQIILYSAFVPALLDILGAKNFILDLSGRTSLGKTTAARVAASVWGDPDESSPSAALATWDSTRVNAERMSTTLQSLPIILDDTKRVKNPKMVADMLYLVASGRGRGRGSTKGLAKVGTWRTVLISTGEQPATSFTTDGGTRARTLTMTGNPFGGEDDKTRRLVEKLNHALMMHYGHAGFRWASWILKHRSEWGKWQKNYVSTTNHYAAQAGNGAQARLAAHWAAIMVAGELVHRAFQLPWEFKAGNYGPLWGAAVQMAEDPAGELTALELVVSWAHSHQESFVGQAPDGRIPPQGWAGKWVAGVTEDGHGNSSYLAFYPTVLRSLLAGWEYQPDAILSGWKSRGWLDINGTGFTHPVRTTGKDAPRMIKLNAEALQAAEDERADFPF